MIFFHKTIHANRSMHFFPRHLPQGLLHLGLDLLGCQLLNHLGYSHTTHTPIYLKFFSILVLSFLFSICTYPNLTCWLLAHIPSSSPPTIHFLLLPLIFPVLTSPLLPSPSLTSFSWQPTTNQAIISPFTHYSAPSSLIYIQPSRLPCDSTHS